MAAALSAAVTATTVTGTAVAAPATAGAISGTAELSPGVAASVHGSGPAARQNALAAYWTPQRMKTARPGDELPSVRKPAAGSRSETLSSTPAKPQGPEQRVAAAAPKTTPQASGVSPMAYPPGYPVGHPVARTVGKVFFTSFGLNYVCSASIVNSEGKSVVWTAGHCVSSGQAWNYNWTFVPNYGDGVAPYGYWYASSLTTTTAWFNNNSDWANDVGAAIVGRNFGYRIADYLGAQGIGWNAAVSGNYVYAFGYPQGAPFTGCCLYAEQGTTYDAGGGTIYMVNYMTGGSSGGPWLNGFDGNWGWVNGHNDFKYTALPQYMYSPYYGNQVGDVYNTVRYTSS